MTPERLKFMFRNRKVWLSYYDRQNDENLYKSMRENEIQNHAVLTARLLGFDVNVVTGGSRKSRSSRTCGDIYVSHETWGNSWLHFDCKKHDGKPTEDQQALANKGLLFFFRNTNEFIEKIYKRHEQLTDL